MGRKGVLAREGMRVAPIYGLMGREGPRSLQNQIFQQVSLSILRRETNPMHPARWQLTLTPSIEIVERDVNDRSTPVSALRGMLSVRHSPLPRLGLWRCAS